MGLTASGLKILLGAIALAVVGRVFGIVEALALGIALLCVLAASIIRVALWHPLVAVERRIEPRRVAVGDEARIVLKVLNRSRRSNTPLIITDAVEGSGAASVAIASLSPQRSETISFSLPTLRRGVVMLGPGSYSPIDPFRVVRRSINVLGESPLIVWPQSWQIDLPLRGAGFDSGQRRPDSIHSRTVSGEFSALREYVAGDDLRHIHWPTSARAGHLLVRRFEPPDPARTWIVLDLCAENHDAFEVAVAVAASVLRSVADARENHSLILIGTSGLAQDRTEGGESRGGASSTVSALEADLDRLAKATAELSLDTGSRAEAFLRGRLGTLAARDGDRLVIIGAAADAPLHRHGSWRIPGQLEVLFVQIPPCSTLASMTTGAAQRLVDQALMDQPMNRVAGHGR